MGIIFLFSSEIEKIDYTKLLSLYMRINLRIFKLVLAENILQQEAAYGFLWPRPQQIHEISYNKKLRFSADKEL